MSDQGFGLKDVPIENRGDEALGLEEYADALVTFVKQCDTPMTIALQGDWGSGKTSLMNLIKSEVEKQEKVKTIWFNTWQYSQFEMADTLALSMLSHFVDEVTEGKESTAKKLVKGLRWLGRFGASMALSQVDGAKEAAQDAGSFAGIADDPAKSLRDLKKELENLVEQRQDVERFIVFVDDLDRLVPIKAVELLENLKLFLDIKKCVYMLACDYNVVVQGLKQKFNVGEADLKGKSFFDKIIQVPFNMPLTQYQVHQYFDTLLDRINVEHTASDIEDYIDLVNFSVGFNPRSMKRLFNSLLLLHLVAERKAILEEVKAHAEEREISKTLFAILCMQSAYEPVYRLLVRKRDLDDEFFSRLRTETSLNEDPELAELRRELEEGGDGQVTERLALFMDAFYASIQLVSDEGEDAAETLSADEVRTLKRIMNFSAVVSTEAAEMEIDTDEGYSNRSMAQELCNELNETYAPEIKGLGKGIYKGGFHIYQKRKVDVVSVQLILWSNPLLFGIYLGFEPKRMWVSLGVERKADINKGPMEWASKHLKSAFPEMRLVENDYYFGKLFGESVDPQEDWKIRTEKFKGMVRTCLTDFMPIFVKGHEQK